ncbi:hypothetical protein A2707_06160 [Candidatus Saccharibacteria bacterium RIFCSPHIGHO2_01_FULL_45_15]|nr:MAG: hypothetical protein A2707_06160 [Candidatus Saccharibacteria bacterium RIFCSPHIGHO2_01_FULL_45_15]OGL26821.1 MAG: hypothetical protein A3C39_04105 [Candidatus Saccharibacteria bacterium RIFCSPHIGHO2_02_FULL_46_12]OGL32043.1 MAG: hypothetical protein A3E76_02100 [Candidatus Saccharibacteria bacterium RIFCSPHIGHO2_12_FULL_44_22]
MGKQNNNSIDGFVRRRSGARVGELHNQEQGASVGPTPTTLRELHTAGNTKTSSIKRSGINRSEIDESLKGIDVAGDTEKGRKRKNPEQKARRRKIIKWSSVLIVLIIVSVGGFVAVKALMAGGNVFQGNLIDAFQNKPLKQDSNGRSNILVLGTSDDDKNHSGADLTDSMMIVSIDQNKKDAYLISIPRDLYVKYGKACNSGYAGKINGYFDCVKEGDSKEQIAAALTDSATFAGDIFGMDIQYGVNLNHTVIRQLVAAVGGITVNIQSRNENGVMDSNFDWKCGEGDRKVTRAERIKRCPPSGHFIDFPNGEVTMDAERALYFTMARGDRAPTYGLEQSNFDREKNQQLVIKAIQKKATSAGTLADIGKVSGLIDAVGDNLRTTFEAAEIRTLMDLGNKVPQDNIKSLPFNDEKTQLTLMGTGMIGAASVVQPSAGLYNYSDLRAYIKENLSSDPMVKEKAAVVILNGSGIAGAGQKEADKLEEKGFTITTIANAPVADYGKVKVYRIGEAAEAPGTAARLKELYGVELLTTDPPVTVTAGTKFVIVVGTIADTTN